MNTPVVDLTNLRSITDGDAEMEKALFEEFYSAFDNGLRTLEASREESASDQWRTSAHALKGVAANLGAVRLGDLCKTAQDSHIATPSEKARMLKEISMEYQQAREFLMRIAA